MDRSPFHLALWQKKSKAPDEVKPRKASKGSVSLKREQVLGILIQKPKHRERKNVRAHLTAFNLHPPRSGFVQPASGANAPPGEKRR